MAIFSKDDLERIKSEQSEPGARPSRNAIVSRVLPLAPVAPHKPVVYSLDDPEPQPEVPAKTEPVAAPPVKKKKVIITDMNTGTRKIEYR